MSYVDAKHNLMIEIIRTRMQELGINARTLAIQSNVGKSFVYDILNGKSKNPTSQKLASICDTLRIPVSKLISNEKDVFYNQEEYISIKKFSLNNEENNECITLHKNIIYNISKSTIENLLYYIIEDDGMYPIIKKGDLVIVDVSNTKIQQNIMLITDQYNNVFTKRIEIIIGENALNLISENERYAKFKVSPSAITIIGKIVLKISNI